VTTPSVTGAGEQLASFTDSGADYELIYEVVE